MGHFKKKESRREILEPKKIWKKLCLKKEKISPKLVRRYYLNFLKRIKKIIEINGNRLEPFHLNQIKKEMVDELVKDVEDDEGNDYITKIGEEKDFPNDLKLKLVYNK